MTSVCLSGGEMIRILYICPKYYPRIGGSAVHVKNIAERLANSHDISVFVPNPIKNLPKEEEINGVKVKRFKCLAPNDSYYFSPSLSYAAAQAKVDILHFHGYYDLTPPLTILLKKHQKCLFTLHSSGSSSRLRSGLHLPYNLVMRKIMHRVDRVICVSKFELEHFQRILNLPIGKVEMIPNGVNSNEFRKDGCIKADPPILLTAGRLEKYKGHHRVLRAFKVFKESYPEINMQLCIVGKGPYRTILERESGKLGIRSSVHFFEWLSHEEYASMLRKSSVFVLLSDYEAMPIALSEALTAGTPAVVANNSGLVEYIRGGFALGVQDPNDSLDAARKIQLAYSHPEICRVKAYRTPSWEEVTKKTLRLYKDLLEGDGQKYP
jgi:glycosyltransferase involved in cell wall biosynthesis